MGRTTSSRRGILIHADDGTVSSYASSAPSVTEGMPSSTGGTTTQQSRSRRKRGATWAGVSDVSSRRKRRSRTSAATAEEAAAASDELDFPPADERRGRNDVVATGSSSTGGRGGGREGARATSRASKRRPSSSSTETESTSRMADDDRLAAIPPSSRSRSATAAGGGNKRRRARSSSGERNRRKPPAAAAPSSPSSRPRGSRSSPSSSSSQAATPVASNASGRAAGRLRRPPPPAAAAATAAGAPAVAPPRRSRQRRQVPPPREQQRRRRHGQGQRPHRAGVGALRPAAARAEGEGAAARRAAGTGAGTATVSEDDFDDDDESVRIVRVLSAPTMVFSSSSAPFAEAEATTPPTPRRTTRTQFLVAVTAFLLVQYGVVRILSDLSRQSSSSPSPTTTVRRKSSSHGRRDRDGVSSTSSAKVRATEGGGGGVPFPLERVWPVGDGGGGGGAGWSIFDELGFFGGGRKGDLVSAAGEFVAEESGLGGTGDGSCAKPFSTNDTVDDQYEFMTMTTAHLRQDGANENRRRRQQRLRREKKKKKDEESRRIAEAAKRREEEAKMSGLNATRAFNAAGAGGPGFAVASEHANPSSPPRQPSWSLSSFSSYLSSSPHGGEVPLDGAETDGAERRRRGGYEEDPSHSRAQQHLMGDPPTLREYLTHPDGFHLAMAPAFFGFYAYFGALIVLDEEVGVLDDVRRRRSRGGDGGGDEIDGLDDVAKDGGGGGARGAIPYCIFCIRDVVRRVTGKVVRGGIGGVEESSATKRTGESPPGHGGGGRGGGAGTKSEGGATTHGRLLRSAAGASAGAMAAILLAAPGRTPRDAADFASTLGLSSFADFPGVLAAFRGDRFEEVMRGYLTGGVDHPSTVRLEDGVIPVAVTGFDLTSFKGRVLSRGCMAKAARASATFPGLFQPVPWSEEFADVEGVSGGTDDGGNIGGEAKDRHAKGSLPTTASAPMPTRSLLIDGGVTDTLGLKGLAALPGSGKRVVNLVVGSFGLTPGTGTHPPGPSRMPPGLHASSVVSVSIVNTPRCGPWAMGNGPRAVEAARRALSDALDVPMERGEEEGHYVLTIDASGFA